MLRSVSSCGFLHPLLVSPNSTCFAVRTKSTFNFRRMLNRDYEPSETDPELELGVLGIPFPDDSSHTTKEEDIRPASIPPAHWKTNYKGPALVFRFPHSRRHETKEDSKHPEGRGG